eukprot:2917799-Amphidinium_carterae.1
MASDRFLHFLRRRVAAPCPMRMRLAGNYAFGSRAHCDCCRPGLCRGQCNGQGKAVALARAAQE